MHTGSVPSYFIYGEPPRPLDVGFLHVETVLARHEIHHGKVAAHLHDHMGQVTFWTAGKGRYRIEDQAWDFASPAVSFIPSGVVHGFEIEDGTDALVVSAADDVLRSVASSTILALDAPIIIPAGGDSELWARLAATLREIESEYRSSYPGREKTLIALLAIALTLIARLSAGSAKADMPPADTSLAFAFRKLVDEKFREPWLVEDYVRALATTPHLLDKAARALFARTPSQLIAERQILEAKRLLLFTIRPVEDVAYELGFKDPAYFSRFFRRHCGEPPGTWRKSETGRRTTQ